MLLEIIPYIFCKTTIVSDSTQTFCYLYKINELDIHVKKKIRRKLRLFLIFIFLLIFGFNICFVWTVVTRGYWIGQVLCFIYLCKNSKISLLENRFKHLTHLTM